MEKFHQLRIEKVMVTFHVKKTKNCTHLNEWLSAQTELTNIETAIIDMALERYEQQADSWNESDGSGRPSTGLYVGCHVIGSHRRTAGFLLP